MHYQKSYCRQMFNKVSPRPAGMGRKAINSRSLKGHMNEAFKSYAETVMSKNDMKVQEQTVKMVRDLPFQKK